MAFETLAWWTLLCAVSVVNVVLWAASAVSMRRRRGAVQAGAWSDVRLQLLLSAAYVLGCAYRSALPVYDVQRQVLVDNWLSSVIVGRSVATLAELCFVAQWALLLRRLAVDAGSGFAQAVARLLVPAIAVAELCSWHAVLTTSNLGHVVEESLWGASAALVVAGLVTLMPHCDRQVRPLLKLWLVAGAVYVLYMFGTDVPMYWSRWVSDEAHGRQYLSLARGVVDASARWVVSHRWDDWKSEVIWMSLYFSVAVWFSIGLVHAAAALHATGVAAPRRAT